MSPGQGSDVDHLLTHQSLQRVSVNLRGAAPGRHDTSTLGDLSERHAIMDRMVPTLIAPRPLASLAGVPHALPYQGSKRNLAHAIVPLIPTGVEHLVEPFAGSAAVSIAALHAGAVERVTIGDLNVPLMQLWRRVCDDPAAVADGYEAIWADDLLDARQRFTDVRERFNRDQDPIDFLYLLLRCVKAAVRYNTRGEFNQGADHRRLGTRPAAMRRRLLEVSSVLAGRTTVVTGDFRPLLCAADPSDVVYLDPPYQGTSGTRDGRYLAGLTYEAFVAELERAVHAGTSMLISYDGTSGEKTYGQDLPDRLGMLHLHLAAGVSSQGTLSGTDARTVESLYASPALVDRLGGEAAMLDVLRGDLLFA